MASDWKIDENDDLVIPIEYVTGVDAVEQAIRVVLRIFKGEWFLNRDTGVPYLPNDVVTTDEALLGEKPNAAKADAAIRKALLSVPDVSEVESIDVEFDGATREMTINWRVSTTFGTIEGSTS